MSTERDESGNESTPVSDGLLLVVKSKKPSGNVRFEWWAVKSTRKLKSGAVKATLISGSQSLSAVAEATFPNGVVADPWRVVNLNQKDWEAVWNGR